MNSLLNYPQTGPEKSILKKVYLPKCYETTVNELRA
jgi:hypothetical protein